MRPALIISSILSLLLAACASTEGLSETSNKPPRGNPNASLVVEEFGDLQCPACRGAHDTLLKPILEKYGNGIRFEFRHFPIRTIHAFAQEAAEAAECAADQGKFWEFVDDTYASAENQARLSRTDLLARAEKVGVTDLALFRRCVKSRIKRDVVQADYEEGIKRGVNGTPTFFVEGERVPANTLEAIGAAIETKQGGQRL